LTYLANEDNSTEDLTLSLYAVSGREGFYEKCGFKTMRTAMAKLNQSMSMASKNATFCLIFFYPFFGTLETG
jgi:N-acetylglutamate synthase-like GNAT family acetyltransferase